MLLVNIRKIKLLKIHQHWNKRKQMKLESTNMKPHACRLTRRASAIIFISWEEQRRKTSASDSAPTKEVDILLGCTRQWPAQKAEMKLNQEYWIVQAKHWPPQSVTGVEKGLWGNRAILTRAKHKIVKLNKMEAKMSYSWLSRKTWQRISTRGVKTELWQTWCHRNS